MNPPPTSWVPFVAATATLIAACVALFKEDIAKLWRRPALSLRLLLGAPDSVQMPIVVTYIYRLPEPEVPPGAPAERQGQWTGDCYFFRLWVKNSGHLAERVQVPESAARRIHTRLLNPS